MLLTQVAPVCRVHSAVTTWKRHNVLIYLGMYKADSHAVRICSFPYPQHMKMFIIITYLISLNILYT